jgi:hypothetical protein
VRRDALMIAGDATPPFYHPGGGIGLDSRRGRLVDFVKWFNDAANVVKV